MPLRSTAELASYPAWARSTEQVAKELQVDVSTGLSDQDVADRQAKYGFNELTKEPGTPLWKLILEQFDDMLVKVRGHIGTGSC